MATKEPDGTFRRITVKVANAAYRIRARRGYFALRPGEELTANKRALAALQRLRRADREQLNGLRQAAAGKYDQARKHFERAIGLSSDFAAYHYNLGLPGE